MKNDMTAMMAINAETDNILTNIVKLVTVIPQH